jgi:isoleucyl-tRNA synthetase
MLCIVSQVSLDESGPDGVAVSVSRAEGQKCDRCWRVLPELSTSVPGLCDRCVAALPEGDGGREVA